MSLNLTRPFRLSNLLFSPEVIAYQVITFCHLASSDSWLTLRYRSFIAISQYPGLSPGFQSASFWLLLKQSCCIPAGKSLFQAG